MKDNKLLQIILVVMLLAAVMAIVFLTLQSPADTIDLSEAVRYRLSKIGLKFTPHEMRSFAHVPEYFIVGAIIAAIAKLRKKGLYIAVTAGCIIGTVDECSRIFLPKREFDIFDLFRDYLGVLLGAAAVYLIALVIKKIKALLIKKATVQDTEYDPERK